MKDAPGLPIWTIHDSIMTVKGQEDIVARRIVQEAKKLIGWAPTVGYE